MGEMLNKNESSETGANRDDDDVEVPLNSKSEEDEIKNGNCSVKKEEAEVKIVIQENLKNTRVKRSCVQLVFGELIILIKGWKIYMRQKVVCAGLALACLYMTVLGFDSVTVAYIYSQGVNEALTGVCQGLGGLLGICGTYLFTKSRKKIGLERTGLIGFNSEMLFLSLTVVSLFLPGTTFKPSAIWTTSTAVENSLTNSSNIQSYNFTHETMTSMLSINTTTSSYHKSSVISNSSYCSIIVFLTGIILSRAGWKTNFFSLLPFKPYIIL